MSDRSRTKGTRSLENMIAIHEATLNTIAEGRRQATRGELLNVQRDNLDLENANRKLEQEKQDLEEKLEAVCALTKMRLVDAQALRHTINHLKKVWEQDNPQSELRKETCNKVSNHHNKVYQELQNDPETQQWAEQQVEAAQKQATKRPRPGK